MSIGTILLISGGIAGAFYMLNRELAKDGASRRRLNESTAMVLVLSAAVMAAVKFFIADTEHESAARGVAEPGASRPIPIGGGFSVPYEYVLRGDPPF
jgi:hypothetical protein